MCLLVLRYQVLLDKNELDYCCRVDFFNQKITPTGKKEMTCEQIFFKGCNVGEGN